MTNDAHDVIVIGAGHNGLAAAALLARAGQRVLVLERRDSAGGLAAPRRFAPGYTAPGILHDTTTVHRDVVTRLELERHGLRRGAPRPLYAARVGTPGLSIDRDPHRAAAELGTDAAAYSRWRGFLERVGPIVRRTLDRPAPPLSALGAADAWQLATQGLAVRRMGKRDMMTLLRVGPQCVKDWLDEHFSNDLLKAALAAPALAATWAGPYSPGTAALLLRHESTTGDTVVGGPAALITALQRACQSAGVEVRTSSSVQRIDVAVGAARGVTLADGSELRATSILSTLDPKTTLLDLIDPRALPPALERGAQTWRTRGTTAKVHLALDGPLPWHGGATDIDRAHIGESLDALERTFDAIKYRRYAPPLMLDVAIPTLDEPSLAPSGGQTVSILVHFVPRDLEGGWTDAERESLGDAVVTQLATYAPGLTDRIVAREILTPADLEAEYGCAGGHVHHGEHALDQLLSLRPMPECARYATPITGLFLGGSGAHPGGGLTCAPARLAADAIRRNRTAQR